jgi:hypothetical protein
MLSHKDNATGRVVESCPHDELMAENAQLRERVYRLEIDVAYLRSDRDRAVLNANELALEAERLNKTIREMRR